MHKLIPAATLAVLLAASSAATVRAQPEPAQPASSDPKAQQPPEADDRAAPDQAAADQPGAAGDDAADAAPADQPDGAGDEATRGAEADSVVSDPPPWYWPPWLVGRWCDSGHERFTISNAHMVIIPEIDRSLRAFHLYAGPERRIYAMLWVYHGVSAVTNTSTLRGLGVFATFNPAEGEGSFRLAVPPFDPLRRC